MTERGYYKMHRGWMTNGVFADEPFTEREAWEWMIAAAVFENTMRNIGGNPISLTRGQFSHSIRFMADQFKWKKDKVARFIEKLRKWRMIIVECATDTATGQNIISICNYSKYQDNRDSSATDTATEARQDRDSSATNKKELNNLNNTTQDARDGFRRVYDEGSELFPALATRRTEAIHRWLEAGADPDRDILPELRRAKGRNIASWEFFAGGIMDALATRTRPLPEGQARAGGQQKPDYFARTVEASRRAVQNVERGMGDGQ